MDEALRLLLTNAVLAGLLALAACVASRLTRRQAVVHGLWLLALLKLVTPPLVELPLLPAVPAPAALRVAAAPAREPLPAAAETPALRRSDSVPGVPFVAAPSPRSLARRAAPVVASAAAPAAPVAPPAGDAREVLLLALPALLALGALAVALLAALRFARFRRLASAAEPAPAELAARAEEIGAALGVLRAPEIVLLPARVPPMLWPASPRPST